MLYTLNLHHQQPRIWKATSSMAPSPASSSGITCRVDSSEMGIYIYYIYIHVYIYNHPRVDRRVEFSITFRISWRRPYIYYHGNRSIWNNMYVRMYACVCVYIYRGFVKWGYPSSHPFYIRTFHQINHLAIGYWGTSIYGNTHVHTCIYIYIENVCARANMADGLSNYPTIFGNPGIGQY